MTWWFDFHLGVPQQRAQFSAERDDDVRPRPCRRAATDATTTNTQAVSVMGNTSGTGFCLWVLLKSDSQVARNYKASRGSSGRQQHGTKLVNLWTTS